MQQISKQWVFFLFAALFFLSSILFLRAPLELNPCSTAVKVKAFDDQKDSGNSKILRAECADEAFHLAYEIREGRQFPYAGVVLDHPDSSWDLSGYDWIEITLDDGVNHDFTLQLTTMLPGFSNAKIPDSWRPYERLVPIGSQRRVRIALNRFETPGWWYRAYDLLPHNVVDQEFSTIRRLLFQNGETNRVGVPQRLVISRVRFGYARWKSTVLFLAGLLSIAAGFWRKKKRRKLVALSYEPRDIGTQAEEDLGIVTTFLGEHYYRSDLTLVVVSRETEIGEKRIRALFEKSFGCPLKKYLNQIRITEAKRLLEETDRTVSDIGLHCGFRSSSTFYRHFHEQHGASPKEYRQEWLHKKR